MAKKARTYQDVQQPMQTEWKTSKDAYIESAKEMNRQKGFAQAEDVSDYMEKYVKSAKGVKMEIDPFMQWDRPREGQR